MRKLIFLLTALVLLSSCSNIFKAGGNKTTDAALLEEATKSIDSGDYSAAIASLLALSTEAKNQDDNRRLLAKAYLGKCGVNFVTFLSSLSGSDPFLLLMMKAWTGKTTDPASCRSAEDTMKLIAPTFATRSGDDAFFMVILGLAKIGVYLDSISDTNDDGLVDSPPFDGSTSSYCSAANISDAQVAEVGVGIGLVFANLTQVGGAIPGSSLDTSTVSSACGLISPNPCLIEDQTTISSNAATVKAIRTFMNTGSVGLVNGLPCP